MVSLDDRSEYLKRILGNEKFLIFYNFILTNGSSVETGGELMDVFDDDFLGMLKSLCESDLHTFQELYSLYSARTPSPTTPFVNDDYLIFCLVVGVKKFSLPQDWLERVLSSRKCTSDDCSLALTTFRNILSENYNSLDNHFGLILVLQSILSRELLTSENKGKLYSIITSNTFPSKKSDFLNIIELHAYDLLIKEALIGSDGEYQVYKKIVKKSEVRIFQLSNIMFYSICLILVVVIIWSYFKYENVKAMIQNFEAIFGFLGLPGIIVMFFNKTKIINFFVQILKRFFWGVVPKREGK